MENTSQCAGGVEHIQNSACACVVLDSQYEKESQETITAKLSLRSQTTFYDAPAPRPPKPFEFENRIEQFPIRDSVQIVKCDDCKGSGRSCGDSGCTEHQAHEKCEGLGKLAQWQVYKFKYYRKPREKYLYPDSLGDPPRRLKKGYKHWLSRHGAELVSFTGPDVCVHIPLLTEDAQRVVEKAIDAERSLRAESSREGAQELFVQPHRYLTPLVYVIARHSGRAEFHFLLGDSDTKFVSPRPVFDWLKMAAWASFSLLAFLTQATLTLGGLANGWCPQPLQELYAATGYSGIAGVALLSAIACIPGVRRMRAPLEYVTAVLVLPSGETRSGYLTLVSHLGAFCGDLEVIDSNSEAQYEGITGKAPLRRGAESLTVKRESGMMRLIEVPNHNELTDREFSRLIKHVDGIVCIRNGTDSVDALEVRLKRLDERHIHRMTIPQSVVASTQHLSFEQLRSGFLRGELNDAAIRQHSVTLLHPLDEILGSSNGRMR